MRLQIKVPLMVIGILVVIGIISGGLALYSHSRASVAQFEQMAVTLSGVVRGSLEQSMVTGESQQTQQSMLRVRDEGLVNAVILFSPDGTIAASTEPSSVGNAVSDVWLRSVLQSGSVSMESRREDGQSELWVTTPIQNKLECEGCHPRQNKVLGAIKVALDTTPLDNETRQETAFIIVLGVLTFGIVGTGLALTLRSTVLNPLSRLTEWARRLSQGEYTAQATQSSTYEIGVLAEALNKMASSVEQRTQELEASKQELAHSNIELENKVEQRTSELSALNSRLEKANRVRRELLEKLISAQEEERRRIARQLHDEASQSLAALSLRLQDISETLPARSRNIRDKLDVLNEQAVKTLGGIRNLALELRPSSLDDLGLAMAIDWYAKDYLAKRGLESTVEVVNPDAAKLPSYTETILFRIVQEALTNIVKHAGATQVKVRLDIDTVRIVAQVEDNGKGFDVDSAFGKEAVRQHLGLHGMAERADLLGGTLTIKSAASQGTCLRVEAPFPKGEMKDGQDSRNTGR